MSNGEDNETLSHDDTIPDLIQLKRDGGQLSDKNIKQIIDGIVDGSLDQCQLGAFLMAVFIQGMNRREITMLTNHMRTSGEILSWPEKWNTLVVDKHSTGGVGDKISLLLAPAIAACDLKVPMISGRGLGFTGGTLDKLESIPGLSVALDTSRITECLEKVGCCIVGQTEKLVPADKKMYACRDVTSTVPSLPLIVSSIISKKAAESVHALILDVKFGKAAFSKTEKEARQLGSAMVEVGKDLGIKTAAVLSSMDTPIGRYVGNSLEIVEALLGLHGEGHPDLMNLVYRLGGELLLLSGKSANVQEGVKSIRKVIENGSALTKFQQMITFQGVNAEFSELLCKKTADTKQLLNVANHRTVLKSDDAGFIKMIDALTIAKILQKHGAGRLKSGDTLKTGVGIELLAHIGDKIEKGTEWLIFYHETETPPFSDLKSLRDSLQLSSTEILPSEIERVHDVVY